MKIPETLKWKATGRTLGEGGQGVVQEVIDKTSDTNEKFALKALSKGKPLKVYERFAREIEAIKKLNHPSIIKILDHSQPKDDFQYYVMELIPGAESLKKFLQTDRNPFRQNPLKSLTFFMQIVEVIQVYEPANVVHRDLSPANILILPDESIKVIDFGLCQIDEAETITLTDEGVGTPNYMAPECEAGAEGDITSSSDLYSAGKLLWSAITNQFAFSREKPVFNAKFMNTLFPEDPNTWHLHHIFEKTIRQNPQNRWKTADEALTASKRIYYLISMGYPPLELIQETCPLCGFGTLEQFSGSHSVFGNPNPQGILSRQCTYCGFCFAVNYSKINETLNKRKLLE